MNRPPGRCNPAPPLPTSTPEAAIPDLEIPDSFVALLAERRADAAVAGPSGQQWLRSVPALVADHLERWDLRPDGAALHGECALVLPVTWQRAGGRPAVLKVTWPHHEAREEHLALRLWDGHGAVRLLAADPGAYVLLLERLDAQRPLTGTGILETCEVIGTLMRALDRPATPQFPRVEDKAGRWAEQLQHGSDLVPRRLTEQARHTLAGLLAEPVAQRLVHEDLHDANVLAPLDEARGEWLAIDPKPVSGEWAYAVAPIVWNRPDAAAAAHNPRVHARLRAGVVAEAAGLDEDRVVAWTLVRLVLNALWAAEHAPASDDFRARMIALAKAFTG